MPASMPTSGDFSARTIRNGSRENRGNHGGGTTMRGHGKSVNRRNRGV